MRNKLLEDKWAVKCIKYLVRKNYSSREVEEAMAKIGIEGDKKKNADI